MSAQQNFDATVEEIASRRIVRADRLRAGACAASIEPCREDPGVVENYQVARVQEIREVAKVAVKPLTGAAPEVKHPGGVARSERFLGYEIFGKMEVKVGDQHD